MSTPGPALDGLSAAAASALAAHRAHALDRRWSRHDAALPASTVGPGRGIGCLDTDEWCGMSMSDHTEDSI